jgi:hypothetical protein
MNDISYTCEAFRSQLPLWTYLDDVFYGPDSWLEWQADGGIKPTKKTRRYLPQEPKERAASYLARLSRSPFSDRFAQALRDFVGLLFVNGVQHDLHPRLAQYWDAHAVPILMQVAITALRRGHSFVLVDAPAQVATNEAAARLASVRWVHLQATDLINWRHERDRLVLAVFRSESLLPDGEYGERRVVSYLRLTPGRYDTFVPLQRDRKISYELDPRRSGRMGVYRNGEIQPLKEIPLSVIYGGERLAPFVSRPPLRALADLNVAHYQTHSDHRNKVRRTCFPVPTLIGSMGDEEVVLSPDIVMRVPPGGAFLWSEPDSSSLERSRTEKMDLEDAMNFLSAQFLIDPGDRQVTAVTQVQAVKVESSLYQFASSLTAGVNDILRHHGAYLGIAEPGQVRFSADFLGDRLLQFQQKLTTPTEEMTHDR